MKWDHNASEEIIAKVKAKLAEHKIKAVNYGVVGIPKEEEAARKIFEFAKKMGLHAITTESVDAIDTIEKLVKEYDIRVGFHDHPPVGPSESSSGLMVHSSVGRTAIRERVRARIGHGRIGRNHVIAPRYEGRNTQKSQDKSLWREPRFLRPGGGEIQRVSMVKARIEGTLGGYDSTGKICWRGEAASTSFANTQTAPPAEVNTRKGVTIESPSVVTQFPCPPSTR